MDFSGLKVVVVGMERSGVAAVELLARKGARVTATDVKTLVELPQAAAVIERLGVRFEPQSHEVFEDADWIVLSPGVPADLPDLGPARARGAVVCGDVELAGLFLRGRRIGITGSNGKTTTTAWTGHLLREAGIPVQVGGNIGAAVSSLVDSSRDDQWNVLELSSFQLETTRTFHCQTASCLNVTPDHLDRHGTFEAYAAAKGMLFATQTASDFAVLNADDPTCAAYAAGARSRPFWFSRNTPHRPGAWLDDGTLWIEGLRLISADRIPLRGSHNVENALAAAAMAHLAGASIEAIASGLASFAGVEHRLEHVRTLAGVDYFNDSKATNVDATLKAIDAFAGGLWVILGGKDKGSEYTPLGPPLARKAKAVLLIGAAAAKIAAQLEPYTVLIDAGTLDQAVHIARDSAVPGDTVLLAPACASFDQFRNYEHRGQVFKQLVMDLKES
ncbi:MAG: UDP-N-acetylmuramoyl-L-alanine--D-glutamate ligase [Bryobacteraceae bacterium]